MPDFQGTQRIIIQPGTDNFPLRLIFPIALSVDGGGAIPYGNTIISALVKIYDPNGLDVTSSMIKSEPIIINPNIVTLTLSYFTGAVEGRYKLTIVLGLSQGLYTEEFDANNRIIVKNL